MKPLHTFAIICFTFLGLASFINNQSFNTRNTGSDFSIQYFSPTQTITIRQNELLVTETKEEFQNPVSAIPSKRVEYTRKAKINKSSLDSLNNLIRSCGFMSLKKSIYGASEGERFYPYTITVRNKNKEKKVLFRSNPSAPSAPKEFSEIEIALQHLVRSTSKWEEVKGNLAID